MLTWTGVVAQIAEDQIAVTAVDAPSAKPAWFQILSSTRIEQSGEDVKWIRITEGTPVRVRYEPAAGAERTFALEILTGLEGEEVRRRLGWGLVGEPPATPPPQGP